VKLPLQCNISKRRSPRKNNNPYVPNLFKNGEFGNPVQSIDILPLIPNSFQLLNIKCLYTENFLLTRLAHLLRFNRPSNYPPASTPNPKRIHTNGVNLMPPGHQSKVVIEDSSSPDDGGCEPGKLFHGFLEFVESRFWGSDSLLEEIS
jgi:hypothetical protein